MCYRNTNNTNTNERQAMGLSAMFATSRTTTLASASTPSRPVSLNRIGQFHIVMTVMMVMTMAITDEHF